MPIQLAEYYIDMLEFLDQLYDVDEFYMRVCNLKDLILENDPTYKEGYFVACFIQGLKPAIAEYVRNCVPHTLHSAYTTALSKELELNRNFRENAALVHEINEDFQTFSAGTNEWNATTGSFADFTPVIDSLTDALSESIETVTATSSLASYLLWDCSSSLGHPYHDIEELAVTPMPEFIISHTVVAHSEIVQNVYVDEESVDNQMVLSFISDSLGASMKHFRFVGYWLRPFYWQGFLLREAIVLGSTGRPPSAQACTDHHVMQTNELWHHIVVPTTGALVIAVADSILWQLHNLYGYTPKAPSAEEWGKDIILTTAALTWSRCYSTIYPMCYSTRRLSSSNLLCCYSIMLLQSNLLNVINIDITRPFLWQAIFGHIFSRPITIKGRVCGVQFFFIGEPLSSHLVLAPSSHCFDPSTLPIYTSFILVDVPIGVRHNAYILGLGISVISIREGIEQLAVMGPVICRRDCVSSSKMLYLQELYVYLLFLEPLVPKVLGRLVKENGAGFSVQLLAEYTASIDSLHIQLAETVFSIQLLYDVRYYGDSGIQAYEMTVWEGMQFVVSLHTLFLSSVLTRHQTDISWLIAWPTHGSLHFQGGDPIFQFTVWHLVWPVAVLPTVWVGVRNIKGQLLWGLSSLYQYRCSLGSGSNRMCFDPGIGILRSYIHLQMVLGVWHKLIWLFYVLLCIVGRAYSLKSWECFDLHEGGLLLVQHLSIHHIAWDYIITCLFYFAWLYCMRSLLEFIWFIAWVRDLLGYIHASSSLDAQLCFAAIWECSRPPMSCLCIKWCIYTLYCGTALINRVEALQYWNQPSWLLESFDLCMAPSARHPQHFRCGNNEFYQLVFHLAITTNLMGHNNLVLIDCLVVWFSGCLILLLSDGWCLLKYCILSCCQEALCQLSGDKFQWATQVPYHNFSLLRYNTRLHLSLFCCWVLARDGTLVTLLWHIAWVPAYFHSTLWPMVGLFVHTTMSVFAYDIKRDAINRSSSDTQYAYEMFLHVLLNVSHNPNETVSGVHLGVLIQTSSRYYQGIVGFLQYFLIAHLSASGSLHLVFIAFMELECISDSVAHIAFTVLFCDTLTVLSRHVHFMGTTDQRGTAKFVPHLLDKALQPHRPIPQHSEIKATAVDMLPLLVVILSISLTFSLYIFS